MKYRKLLTILTISLLSAVALIGCDNKEKNTTVAQKETTMDNKVESTVEVQLLQTLSTNLKLIVAAKDLPAQPQEVAYNEVSEDYSYSEPQQATTNNYGVDEAALVSFLLANSTHPEYAHFMIGQELYDAGWPGEYRGVGLGEGRRKEVVDRFINAYTNNWINFSKNDSQYITGHKVYYTDGVNLFVR